MKILDLDMDYFMDSVAHTPDSVLERLSEADYGDCVWSERRVRSFLEENLGLSKERKLPGRIVCGHNALQESYCVLHEPLHPFPKIPDNSQPIKPI